MVGKYMILFFCFDWRVQISTVFYFFQFCLGLIFSTSDSYFLYIYVPLVCWLCGVWEIFLDCPRCESGPCWKLFIVNWLQGCLFMCTICCLVEVFYEFCFGRHSICVVCHVFDVDGLCFWWFLVVFLQWQYPKSFFYGSRPPFHTSLLL